ncbi:MAG: AAA family ATPase [Kiritimatiellia bacterium]
MTAPSTPPVWIHSITLRQFAGVDPDHAFTLSELSSGINIIFGPNGCGKSTTGRAVRHLLWPEPQSEYTDLQATVRREDDQWLLVSRGLEVKTLVGDDQRPHPVWAASETRNRYHWSLRNLLEQQDRDLARQITAEMAGGIDFTALAAALNWDKKPSAPSKLHQHFLDADREIRRNLQAQQALMRESEKLDALITDRDRAGQIWQRAGRLETALELIQKQRQLHALQQDLEAAPPHMDHLRGDDADRMQTLLDKQQRLQEQLRSLHEKRAALGGGESAWALFAPEDFKTARLHIDGLLKQIEDTERRHTGAADTLAELETREQHLRAGMGIRSPAGLGLEQSYHFPELRNWIQQVLRGIELKERTRLLQNALSDFPPDTARLDPDRLRDARRDLESWLKSQAPGRPLTEAPFWLSWLGLTGLLLLLVREFNQHPVILLISLPFIAFHLLWRRRKHQDWLREIQSRYPDTLPAPESWTEEAVRHTLRALDALAGSVHLYQLEQADRERLEDAAQALEELTTRCREIEDHLREQGLDPAPDPEWISHFLEDVQKWRQLRQDAAAAESTCSEIRGRLRDLQDQLKQHLTRWHAAGSDDTLTATAQSLLERMETERERRRETETLHQQEQQLLQQEKDLQHDLTDLCNRLGLEQPDPGIVRERVRLLEPWQQQFRNSETLTARLSELRNALGEEASLAEQDEEDLRDELARCQQAREEERRLQEEIIGLQKQIEITSRGRSVHEAGERLARIRGELSDERNAHLRTRMGMEIIDWLQESCRTRERPRVLEQANQNLARFSGGSLQLRLSLERAEGEFTASRPGQNALPLHRLSTGERTQVLMAVRLAFLHLHERAPLPLLVDEALGTSDDQRAEAVMKSLIEVSQQGRQIFYFTAQMDEVQKWRNILRATGTEAGIVDLQAVRNREQAADLPDLEHSHRPVIDYTPRADESLSEWGKRLQVADWHPRQPLADLPLWYLLNRQPDTLSTLLTLGIHTVGAYHVYQRAGTLTRLLVPADLAEIDRKITALGHLQEAWRIGRPPALPGTKLIESGCVSDNFLEQVLDLSRECRGDAAALLEKLTEGAVKGFRKNKIDELRDYLRDEGFLSSESPLSLHDIQSRAMLRMNEQHPDPALPPETWRELLPLVDG